MSDRRAIGTGRWLLWKLLGWVWWPIDRVVFRTVVRGAETLPAEGAWLLLANHTSTLDTVWVGAPVGRPVHFMASAAMFRSPVAGFLLRSLLAFPKEVGVKDRDSARTVQDLVDSGQIVQIMPEGVRTWDGRPMPVGSAIGRMVKRLGIPVVVCRVQTGHLCWPRWADWPRWVPLHLEFHPPRTFEDDVPDEEIRDWIVEEMTPGEVDFGGARLWGIRRARGLPVFLWACPECGGFGPQARKHVLSCGSCGAAWTVMVDNAMVGEGQTPDTTVAAAYDRIRERVGQPPVADRARFEADGVALEADDVVIYRLARGRPKQTAGQGRVQLTAEGLRLVEGGWELPLAEIVAVGMDAGNVLHLRTQACIWRVAPADGSTWLWENFVRGWWEQAREG